MPSLADLPRALDTLQPLYIALKKAAWFIVLSLTKSFHSKPVHARDHEQSQLPLFLIAPKNQRAGLLYEEESEQR